VNRFQVQRDRLAADGPQKWLDSLLPKVEQLRQQLAQRDPHDLASRSGAIWDNDAGALRVQLWDKAYLLTPPAFIAREADGTEARMDRQALLLIYLHTADGTPPAHTWRRYRELPGGLFYAQAFAGYAEVRLARAFHDHPEAFDTAATRLNGSRLPFSSNAFAFVAMPRIPVAAVLWPGDADFPSNATILFDAAVSHYLPIDITAALGSQLVSRLIKAIDVSGQTLTALAVQPPRQ